MVGNQQTEFVIKDILNEKGYAILNPEDKINGQTGVDILAVNGKEVFYIEVIGYKKSGPARSKDFFEIFFRAISRLSKEENRICIIALPFDFTKGIIQRVKNYNTAWERIGNSFPELKVWFVKEEGKLLYEYRWNDLLNFNIKNIDSHLF